MKTKKQIETLWILLNVLEDLANLIRSRYEWDFAELFEKKRKNYGRSAKV